MVTSLLLAVASVKSGSVVKKTLPLEQKQGVPFQQGPVQTAPQQQGPVQAPQQAPAQQNPQPAK